MQMSRKSSRACVMGRQGGCTHLWCSGKYTNYLYIFIWSIGLSLHICGDISLEKRRILQKGVVSWERASRAEAWDLNILESTYSYCACTWHASLRSRTEKGELKCNCFPLWSYINVWRGRRRCGHFWAKMFRGQRSHSSASCILRKDC